MLVDFGPGFAKRVFFVAGIYGSVVLRVALAFRASRTDAPVLQGRFHG